ncbi:MAG: hypothetical protein ACRDTF_15965, partial [Pseudonocardiaceae bacterium]
VNPARRIDASMAAGLYAAPALGGPISVPEGTLLRGYAYGLPTGEAVAGELGLTPLSASAVAATFNGTGGIAYPTELGGRTPLWYYVLAEAKHHGGTRLGPVGSTIVAEVLIGLVRRSADSILTNPGWKPSLPAAKRGKFELDDLLRFARVLPPSAPTT